MHDAIDALARDQFGFVALPEALQQAQRRLIERLLTTPFSEADKDLQTYIGRVRALLIQRLHETKHRKARVGLELHAVAVVSQAGLRQFCLAGLRHAAERAKNIDLLEGSAAISVLRVRYMATPYTSAEVAQACREKLPAQEVLEIAAMKLSEDPLGAAMGILGAHGVTGREDFFKSKGLLEG